MDLYGCVDNRTPIGFVATIETIGRCNKHVKTRRKNLLKYRVEPERKRLTVTNEILFF